MTPEKKAALREAWRKGGKLACKHRIREEEQGTGAHICIRCGTEVAKQRRVKNPHGER